MVQTIINNGDSGLVARTTINDNFTELYKRDAASYGFDPSATASVNTAALQAALDVGGVITVNTPGTYELNDTLYIGSNTRLLMCIGVIFKKTGYYSNVLLNSGALTKTYDENIEVAGLQIEVNGVDNLTTLLVDGLRGQLSFFYVKNLILRDFKCLDLGIGQFCIHIVTWERVYFNNIHIEGEKDGIDLGPGHDFLGENIIFKTYDDAIALIGQGYTTVTPEVGDVYNVTFRNVIDNVKNGLGYLIRPMAGSWADYSIGNAYKTSDLCVNAGNIYMVDNTSGFSAVGANAPVHSSGIVTGADGIEWRFLQVGAFYTANIYNVTLDNITCLDPRSTIGVYLLDSADMRAAYPGTEDQSFVSEFKVTNSSLNNTDSVVCRVGGNLKEITFGNCVFDDIQSLVYTLDKLADSNPLLKVSVTGCVFKNIDDVYFLYNLKQGLLIDISMAGNTYESCVFSSVINGTSEIRMINPDLPVSLTHLNNFSPEIGDMCRVEDGIYIYKSIGWDILSASYGSDMVTNGEFESDTNWTKQTGWGISGGKANCDGSQVGTSMLYQAKDKIVGEKYLYIFKVSGYSVGSVRIRGGQYGMQRTANGSYSEIIENTPDYNNHTLVADVDFIGSIDYFIVKRVL